MVPLCSNSYDLLRSDTPKSVPDGWNSKLIVRFRCCKLSFSTAIQRILETAKTAGIRAGIHCLSPAYAREMISMGFDLVTVGSDIRILTSATVAALEAVRS